MESKLEKVGRVADRLTRIVEEVNRFPGVRRDVSDAEPSIGAIVAIDWLRHWPDLVAAAAVVVFVAAAAVIVSVIAVVVTVVVPAVAAPLAANNAAGCASVHLVPPVWKDPI